MMSPDVAVTASSGDGRGSYSLASDGGGGNSANNVNNAGPRDDYNRCYLGFVMAGVGFLLPYNR